MTARDGLWHPLDRAVQATATFRVYGNDVRRTVYRGVIARCVDGVWERETCPHRHTKRRSAIVCAQQAARRVNAADARDAKAAR